MKKGRRSDCLATGDAIKNEAGIKNFLTRLAIKINPGSLTGVFLICLVDDFGSARIFAGGEHTCRSGYGISRQD